MMEQFYRAFEERLRGSRALIKERQTVYLPFIAPLKMLYASCPALDLGCGRGEWLEILRENGFEARGVDLDQGMLEGCDALSLPAEQGEALETLKLLADESLALISGFHIAEHMPFERLQQLVAEALRVLKPAGLLILESPNAENLVVGTNNFYLDPTHERPIPHLLLSFLTEYTGFARFKLLRLQEPPELAKAERVALMNVLASASPDYGIVAQKGAPAGQTALFDQAFEKEYGLALDTLARRYDDGLKEELECFRRQLEEAGARSREVEAAFRGSIARTIQAEVKQAAVETLNETLRQQAQQAASESNALWEQARQLNAQLQQERQQFEAQLQQERQQLNAQLRQDRQQFEAQLHQARQQLEEVQRSAHHWHLQANTYEAQAKDVLSSTSWRVTKPLRLLMIGLRRLGRLPWQATRRVLRPVLAWAMRWVMGRPELKRCLVDRLRRHPTLFQHLRLFALNRGLLGPMPSFLNPQPSTREVLKGKQTEDLSTMSPRARQIYMKLKEAIREKGAH
ncbi:O-antigen chain-terminating methyltransferase [Azotobacter beijerinckii]|uniref:O-antigen chain-terminating methyltransferase n=1 Tax=Azotobacter beijerinckii TaxID=170623 RepID=A0A1H9GQW1_9GAMM|nr:class I SAM-dependent methyltransferase [Azotobacter beijerinckii]SEQ52450.1 O-antigen chain-terminating methyltransferase [Azotobacter beijerinckii]